MRRGRTATAAELKAQCLGHVLAHTADVRAGRPHRGCPFCPTLRVRLGRSRPGYLSPERFPQPFYRDLARRMNRIRRMARSGHFEATIDLCMAS
jgi:hypothetical protein